MFQESERLRVRWETASRTAERHAADGQKDLRSALSALVDEVEAAAGLRVSLRAYGAARPLTGEAQHALLQVACEALFNVVRHANAERAWLTVRWQTGGVRLIVADDGNGAPEAIQRRLRGARPSGHRGLANIGERMRALRGSARFERRRGGGVKLTVEVPLGGAVGGSP